MSTAADRMRVLILEELGPLHGAVISPETMPTIKAAVRRALARFHDTEPSGVYVERDPHDPLRVIVTLPEDIALALSDREVSE